jgi:hypothetical protein
MVNAIGPGITRWLQIRAGSVAMHSAQTVREQPEWHPHRPTATNPAGALAQVSSTDGRRT